ncbi:hypothetical protein ANN_24536 [Periplaneta americana]|uniref:Transposable element P transposase-like RNase H domain-containing protein n=1 Tax=Periplaneta americana TaxID=6978 RepID=A0ABQ8S3B2_PERAM|nr:hypothetical protein ANN_24536 [Periplaneta americana]
MDKISVLLFDEMNVNGVICYDHEDDSILGPHRNAQIVMIRGLAGEWKQPIYYDFDKTMNRELLFEIITEIEVSGFRVVAIVSDLGGGNRRLWNELQINVNQTCFSNPASDANIWVFADLHHLIKIDTTELMKREEMEALRYVAGYIARKCNNKSAVSDANSSQQSPGWIEVVSRGGLVYPLKETGRQKKKPYEAETMVAELLVASFTRLEEQRLRVFEIKVLRKLFGAKRDEVTGEWRKLHNAELHTLYSSPDVIKNINSRRLRWAGHVVRMSESRNAYRVLVGRPEGNRPLGRSRRKWEDNIKMDLREIGYDDGDWINLAQDRDRWRAYVRAEMNLRCEDEHAGSPSRTVTTPENINKVRDLVLQNRRVSIRDIVEETGFSYRSVHDILVNELIMKKITARWVPRMLTPTQKRQRAAFN